MADITKCNGDKCEMKEYCYRYTAKASENQSYFMGATINDENDNCEYYWKDKENYK